MTTSLLTLVAELRRLEHHVMIFAPDHQQREPETHVLRFPSFVSVFNREYPLAFPFVPFLALAPYFNRLRLNVVHTHTPFVLGLTGANLALLRNVPLVSTFHTLYSQYSHYVPFLPEALIQSILVHYLPWYYNRCAAVITPSELAANTLRELGVERPITVIPTGVPLPEAEAIGPEARACARLRIGMDSVSPMLLYTGRIAKEKNLSWLLEVFSLIRQEAPTARLVLAGGGPYLEELCREASERQLGDSVQFLGPTPRHEMDSLYAACDAFCFPSPSETQGLVIGEARAAGAPCVVVDAGGAPETVRDGEDGFRVPQDDARAFADRVLQIVRQPALRESLSLAARRNAHNYTPGNMARQVLRVYAQAAKNPAPVAGRAPAGVPVTESDWEAWCRDAAVQRYE